ncbi:MAG TPA: AlkA N-terminal domain-containing protein [Candidatus Binatia bacterium]|nr:AlkA N-terminal domain-containing protein [Candidatus Binatia bacterium]
MAAARGWRATLPVRQPFPWDWLIEYLSARLIPGAEQIVDGAYLRSTEGGAVQVRYDPAVARLKITTTGTVDKTDALRRVARLFDIDHDAAPVMRHLRRSPLLARSVRALPGLRPLGAWSPFELTLRTVLGQQVTVAAANTLMRRLVERCEALTPEGVLAADLGNMGMPGKRVETLRLLAAACLRGDVPLECGDWPRVDAALRALPGFGPWTRSYLAIRLGRDTDAFPETDVGLVRGAKLDSSGELLRAAEAWRPYRAHATIYLWSAA